MQFSPSHVPVMIAGMVRVMDQESSGVNIHYRACEYKFAPATRLGVARHRVSSRSGVDGVSDRGKQPPAGYRDARTSFAKCCVRPLGLARCGTAYPGEAPTVVAAPRPARTSRRLGTPRRLPSRSGERRLGKKG